MDTIDNIRESYDRVASEYVAHLADELQHKPFDRMMLALSAELAQGGLLCEVGCGPGHITRYLHDLGANVYGCDISPAMIAQAQARNPHVRYQVSDLRALDAVDHSLAGIIAFYSLIHLPRAEIVPALRHLRDKLAPNGFLMAAYHLQNAEWQDRTLNDWWNIPVNITFLFHTREDLTQYFTDAGYKIEMLTVRAPYAEHEAQTHRAYILARPI